MEYGFPWNDSKIVEKYYKEKNYKVTMAKGPSTRVLICFSSHGLYFPNTEERFEEVIGKRDYYEWQNLAKHRKIQSYFGKIIFVRDLYKQCYIMGINSEANDIYKAYEVIKEETLGCEITTIGNSGGGYAASFIGTLLGADRIINVSGPYDISLFKSDNPLVYKYKEDERSKYFHAQNYVKDNSNIFHLMPAYSEFDIEQIATVNNSKINIIKINEHVHGKTVEAICFPYLLTMEKEKLQSIFNKYNNYSEVEAKVLLKEIIPFKNRIIDRISGTIIKINNKVSKIWR